jgi:hypothetical protein
MTTASATKLIPLISSGTAGPLGAVHLPRLWLKLTLAAHDVLADGYDEAGAGFDAMTLAALGLDKDKTIAFVRENHPTYVQFEEYVVNENGGSVSPDAIAKHNAAVLGYDHDGTFADPAEARKHLGIKDESIKNAVLLNTLDDLASLHEQLEGTH